jgi:chemotaxis signal transduction protein
MHEEGQSQETGEHYLLFRLDLQNYAVAFSQVIRVVPVQKATPVPAVPDYIEGIIHSNGQFIPHVNMKQMLGLQDLGLGDPIHSVIVRDSENRQSFSFSLDSKGDIIQKKEIEKDIKSKGGDLDFYSGQFVHGDEIVFILDIDRLMDFYKVEKDQP